MISSEQCTLLTLQSNKKHPQQHQKQKQTQESVCMWVGAEWEESNKISLELGAGV